MDSFAFKARISVVSRSLDRKLIFKRLKKAKPSLDSCQLRAGGGEGSILFMKKSRFTLTATMMEEKKWSSSEAKSCLRFTLRDYTEELELTQRRGRSSRESDAERKTRFLALIVTRSEMKYTQYFFPDSISSASLSLKSSVSPSLMMVSFALTFFMWFSH